MIDWTFNVGNIVTILVTLAGFAGGAFALYYGLKSNVDKLTYMLETFGGRIINVETEMRAMRDVLTQMAVYNERMANLDQRISGIRTSYETFRAWVQERISKLENSH